MTQNISFGLLEAAFTNPHFPELFFGQATHDAVLSSANHLVRHTDNDAIIIEIIESCLPQNYTGDSLKELPGMIISARERGYDQPAKEDKDINQAEQIIRAVENSGVSLFHDRYQNGYITIPQESGGCVTFLLSSVSTSWWLKRLFRTKNGKVPQSQAVRDAIEQLQSMAVLDGGLESVHLRVAGDAERVDIDMGCAEHKVIQIRKNGWSVEAATAFRFYRATGFGELPEPERAGDLRELQKLLQLSDENWHLLLAFLINCLKPRGPYMCLLVEGEQGSGKSLLCSIIKRLIDPSEADRMTLPRKEHDLFIHAKEFFLLNFDNTSGMPGDISDALCKLSTGGGYATRRLYANDELTTLNYCRPYIINGISDYANRPDLLERAIPMRLPSLAAGKRQTERQIFEAFDATYPMLLGCLYDIAVHALAHFDEIEPPTHIRMADCAQWLMAAEGAIDIPQGSLIKALEVSQSDMMVERIINQPLVIALYQLLEEGVYEGLMGDLYSELILQADNHWTLPKTAAHLSKDLNRLAPALKKAGIYIEFGRKTKVGKPIKIWREGEETSVRKPIGF